jgi:hypothetical protein
MVHVRGAPSVLFGNSFLGTGLNVLDFQVTAQEKMHLPGTPIDAWTTEVSCSFKITVQESSALDVSADSLRCSCCTNLFAGLELKQAKKSKQAKAKETSATP